LLLRDKAVVVTGAGGGIGRACAIEVARQGGRVVVNDIRAHVVDQVVAEIGRAGGQALGNHDSISTWNGAASAIKACLDGFGAINGLVNVAALCHTSEPWEEVEADIRAQVDVNVLGVLFCGTHAMREMIQMQAPGSIVNFASGAAFGQTLCGTYGATKGAVASATYSWAFDLQPHRIRVNAIAPATTSRMGDYWLEAGNASGYRDLRPTRAEMLNSQAAPDEDGPESIAPLVSYLLSDRSEAVTGQFIQLHAIRGGNRLSVIPHSTDHLNPEGPTLVKPTWTFDDVAAAFESVFGDRLQPVADYQGRPRGWTGDASASMPSGHGR
jgi:NAD(P)-dependent dehydrogenase (short-subunit alcohol dehydrogenase family)